MTAAKKRQGRVVRLSKPVEAYLKQRKRGRESFDSILRRVFGLPDKRGAKQPLKIYFVIDEDGKTPLIYRDQADARGEAVLRAVKRGSKKTEPVLKVQELPR